MKLHRFYLENFDVQHSIWIRDESLVHQWTKVLRFQNGREIALFNNQKEVALYRIVQIEPNAVKLELVTAMEPKLPKIDMYLCFSLLKKDKNDWILQKATELGVSHLVPLICDRTEKTGFDVDRAHKIVTEASEQCGRADIPRVREPITPEKLLDELVSKAQIFIAEQGSLKPTEIEGNVSIAALIGPEGGWSDAEKQLFSDKKINHLALSEFTLRAETAAITSASILMKND